MPSIKLENGKTLKLKADTEITCETHGIKVTYGSLDPIQKMAFEEGLDTTADIPCLLVATSTAEEISANEEVR